MTRVSAKAALGWDLVAATATAAAVGIFGTDTVSNGLAKDLLGVATSVLAIVFSMFVTALAIIVSSGTDDFIRFLKDEAVWDGLVAGFKLTLFILLASLIFSIALYGITAAQIDAGASRQPILWLAIEVFALAWSLFSTASTTHAAIRYSEFRARFLKVTGPT
jgi:hypothetical protein